MHVCVRGKGCMCTTACLSGIPVLSSTRLCSRRRCLSSMTPGNVSLCVRFLHMCHTATPTATRPTGADSLVMTHHLPTPSSTPRHRSLSLLFSPSLLLNFCSSLPCFSSSLTPLFPPCHLSFDLLLIQTSLFSLSLLCASFFSPSSFPSSLLPFHLCSSSFAALTSTLLIFSFSLISPFVLLHLFPSYPGLLPAHSFITCFCCFLLLTTLTIFFSPVCPCFFPCPILWLTFPVKSPPLYPYRRS